MNNKSLIQSVFVIALVLTALIIHNALDARKSFERVVTAQKRINDSLNIHINTFQTLEIQTEGWDKGLRHISDAQDLLGMYELIDFGRFGLSSPIDSFRLVSADPYNVHGVDIGLVKVCVDGGNRAIMVNANNYGELIDGIAGMAQSRDLMFDFVNIGGGSQQASAQLGNLCILLNANTGVEA